MVGAVAAGLCANAASASSTADDATCTRRASAHPHSPTLAAVIAQRRG